MKPVLLRLIDLYQKYLSPLKGQPTCRFTPTCSQYAREAIIIHGAICGGGLALWRILRCNPFCKGGHDPVPPKKKRHSSHKGERH